MAVTFYDRENRLLGTYSSAPLQQAEHWTDVRIGPITPGTNDAGHAIVHLCLEPAVEADLSGSAWFDDIRLGRLPRMTLEINSDNSLYVDRRDVEVTCRVSGFSDPDLRVRFELLDWQGETLANEELATQRDGPFSATGLADESIAGQGGQDAEATFCGSALASAARR